MKHSKTKTITVLFNDEQNAIKRWVEKDWKPVERMYHKELDPKDKNKTIMLCTIQFIKE